MTARYRTLLTALIILLALGSVAPIVEARSIPVRTSTGEERVDGWDDHEITYFCFSELVNMLGGYLDWEMVGHQVSYIDNGTRMDFFLESPFFTVNDSAHNLVFPAGYKDGKLYLPAETFLPFFNQLRQEQITWDDDKNVIRIDSDFYNVTDMTVARKANGLLVEIYLAGALTYDVFVTEGNWVNISIRDGLISPKIKRRLDRSVMYQMKTHQVDNTGQISFRLRQTVERWHHRLVAAPPRIQISIADVDFQLDTAETRKIGPDDKVDVIVIDPGHGGSHYGAIGPGGTREKDIVLNISQELAKLIRKDKQFKVIMTRDRDKTVSLQERADIANSNHCDLFISIHANASPKRAAHGWNVFFLAPARNDSARAVAQFENSAFLRELSEEEQERLVNYEEADPVLGIINEMIMTEFQTESHDFAMMVDKEFRRNLETRARGVDQAGFFVLNMVFSPSILVEAAFVSNPNEEKLLRSSDYQKRVAQGIYDAIKRFKAKYEGM